MDLLHGFEVFSRIVETGSFSAVARENGTSHSAVTRLVGQLEEHFGLRLFHRTTRRLTLTEDGHELLVRARDLLDTAQQIEETIGRGRTSPTGLVRVGIPVGGAVLLTPKLPVFSERYPGLSMELVVGDRFGDLIQERLDVAVILGQPADSSLVSRAIGRVGRITVAAPAYLERVGAPSHPNDLLQHNCIVHTIGPDSDCWRFENAEGPVEVRVTGNFHANNSEIVHRAAIAGQGIAKVSELFALDDLRAGRLVELLTDYPSERQPIFLIYPSRRHLPPRTRAVIDFIVETTRNAQARLAEHKRLGQIDAAWLV